MASCSREDPNKVPAIIGAPAPLFIRLEGMDAEKIDGNRPVTKRFPADAKYRIQKEARGIVITVSPKIHAPGVLCGAPANLAELPDATLEHPDIGISAMCVVLNKERQLLVVTRRRGGWKYIPGALVMPGETMNLAMRRGVRAKTGQNLPSWPAKLFRMHESFVPKSNIHNMMAMYGPVTVEEPFELVVTDDSEVTAAEWVHLADFYAAYLKDPTTSQPSIVDVLQHIANEYRADFEFEQNGCYQGARDESGNKLLFDLAHMKVSLTVGRNESHPAASLLTRELLG